MGTQPEAGTYDATVYEYEITDAVIGGPGGLANAPILNLANRTGWLRAQVLALQGAAYTTLAAVQAYCVATFQPLLGFIPVQQGTGIGQTSNAIKIGWSLAAKPKLTVDATDEGNIALETWVQQTKNQSPLPFTNLAGTNYVVPANTFTIKARMVAGGGGGDSCNADGNGGGGGGAGEYGEVVFAVTPGQTIGVAPGAGGAGGVANGTPAQAGSNSQIVVYNPAGGVFATYFVLGGAPAITTGSAKPGGFGGSGGQSTILSAGGDGSDGGNDPAQSGGVGNGGASFFGGGGRAGTGGGHSGQAWGSGGGGAYSANKNGAPGRQGFVIFEI